VRRAAARGNHEVRLSPLNGQPGCNGKRQYDDHATADRIATTQKRRTEEPIEPYRCRYCQKWHVGNPRIKKKEHMR
jgi:hypothetical protein